MNETTIDTNETNDAPEEVKVDALQPVFDAWYEAEVSEDAMIVKLHEEHELSYPAAVNRLRALKKGAGLTRPRGHKSEEVRAFISDCHEAGEDRQTIIQKLQDNFGYTKNSAASTFSTQGSKLGIAGGGSFGGGAKRPLNEVVAFARAHADKGRKDFVAAMVEELGYTESTAGAFYTYMGFAKEYARQEVEAA